MNNTTDQSVQGAVDALLAPSEPVAEEVVAEAVEPELNETEAEEAPVDDDSGEEAELEDDSGEDEYEAEEEQEADQAGPDTFTIKVDGEQVEVTLDDLKRDYSGQAYIQKGMKQAAEARKQAETAFNQLQQQQQQLGSLMQQLNTDGLVKQPVPPSAAMAQDDPLGYIEAQAKFQENMGKFQSQRQQIAKQGNAMKRAQTQAQKAYLQEQMVELAKVIPDFSDADKATKLKSDLVQFGSKVGYSPEEIGQVSDSRAINTLHKAMLYDQIMAGKTKVDAKVKKAKPLIKAGAKKPTNTAASQARQQRAKLKKSGSMKDAAEMLFNG